MPNDETLLAVANAIRKRAFRNYYFGGCHLVSRWVEKNLGIRQVVGCYVDFADGHVVHCWNETPDGEILDLTAGQFFGERAQKYTTIYRGDSDNYIEDCECAVDCDCGAYSIHDCTCGINSSAEGLYLQARAMRSRLPNKSISELVRN